MQKLKRSPRRQAPSLCLLLLLLFPALAHPQPDPTLSDSRLHLDLMPYFMVSGLSGSVTVYNQNIPVNASATDLLHHLKGGFMGRGYATYNRWFVGPDVGYMHLAAPTRAVDIDVHQWGAALYAGYRLNQRVRVYTGVRYNNITAGLNFNGPFGKVRSGSQTWWDPVLGAQAEIPIRKKLTASAAFDLGGFGAGSKIAVNAEPLLNYQLKPRLKLTAGWKFFYQDYKNSTFTYDMLAEGPFLGCTLHW